MEQIIFQRRGCLTKLVILEGKINHGFKGKERGSKIILNIYISLHRDKWKQDEKYKKKEQKEKQTKTPQQLSSWNFYHCRDTGKHRNDNSLN